VSALIGEDGAKKLVNQALFLITLGGNDFVNNYYLVPYSARSREYALPDYVVFLISEYRKILLVYIFLSFNFPLLNYFHHVNMCFYYHYITFFGSHRQLLNPKTYGQSHHIHIKQFNIANNTFNVGLRIDETNYNKLIYFFFALGKETLRPFFLLVY
jgi:hypothetical protein